MRVRQWVGALLTSVAIVVAVAGPAIAQDEEEQDHAEEEGPTTSFTIPPGIGINEGIFIEGAVVTPPDGGPTRTMDEYQAAVFAQSWMGSAFFGDPNDVLDPPADAPVYRIDIAGTWNHQPGNVTAYFAQDGDTPYIAFPGIVVWSDPLAIPPPSQWFVPPARVVETFQGEGELIDTSGREIATSIPGSGFDQAASGDGDGESDLPWVWIATGAGAALAAVGATALRRRRRPADAEPDA